ncbi:CLUMA_CG008000, isoform A [Clunio marinus]|uniref:CLUMA_CG008000, isoform A n=1 Tax=Clunio marinus TaxID=568069 RepID=A0A1J1I6D1_9DIPT|nr:CLUMA_CG008000, isoform A [Clunio marinus]
MRKVWVPKESLYPKPFYKRKLFVFFILLILSSLLFLAYQLYFVNQLANSTEILRPEHLESHYKASDEISSKPHSKRLVETKREFVLGIRIRDIDSYTRIYVDQNFKCLTGNEEISWDKLNDNYCDCIDGSDETFTNACPNGKFYCKKQIRHKTGRGQDVWVPSSRINDGICDCKLDCSDEF